MANKTRNGETWTEARFHSFVKGGLRSASQRWPPKYSVLNEACTGQKINHNTGRLAKHYRCSNCGFDFPQKQVEVDHVVPVIGPEGFVSWDMVVERMFCEKDKLAVLCKPCHKIKSKQENEERKSNAK